MQQIVLVHLQPFRRSSLLKCAPQPKIAKSPIIKVQVCSRLSMLIFLKSSLAVLVIGKFVSICNRFQVRLANREKITTFRESTPI